MTEKELVARIRLLRQIKPSKDWVVLTKREILGENPVYFLRPALVGVFAVFIAVFLFAQNALPGEKLYVIKKITEKGQAVFVSEGEKPKLNLELANKRLEELNQIAENNDVKKLAPAIKEVQKSATEVAKSFKKITKPDQEIVARTKELEKNRERAEKILGTKIETEEYNDALADLVKNQIDDLEKRALSDEQKEILAQVKVDYEAGNYSQALEKILLLK
jgi:hypothetical protein